MTKIFKLMIAAAVFTGLSTTGHAGTDFKSQLTLVEKHAQQMLKEWTKHPFILEAIREQNAASSSLTFEDIVALDKQWRGAPSKEDNALLQESLNNKAAGYLQGLQAASVLAITEVFVMDNRGLNVAQSGATSDYWQGDEDKWLRTYYHNPAVDDEPPYFIDDIEHDSSTGAIQVQVSLPIRDPENGETIGAITYGINLGDLNS